MIIFLNAINVTGCVSNTFLSSTAAVAVLNFAYRAGALLGLHVVLRPRKNSIALEAKPTWRFAARSEVGPSVLHSLLLSRRTITPSGSVKVLNQVYTEVDDEFTLAATDCRIHKFPNSRLQIAQPDA